MFVIAIICSVILVVEFILHGLAMLIGMEAGITPLVKHLGFRPHRALVLLIGVVDMAVVAGLVAGFWNPAIGIAAAGYGVALFGSLMIIRLAKGLGTVIHPPDFPIFLLSAVVLLITYLVR